MFDAPIAIRSVEWRRAAFELDASFSTARLAVARRETLVVTLRDDHGAYGVGEAAPLPGYSPDTLADVEHVLVSARAALGHGDMRCDPETFLTALASRCVFDAHAAPSALFALESAAFDLAARRAGTTVAALIALDEPTVEPLVCAVLGLEANADRIVARVTAAFERGLRAVKLKLPIDDDAFEKIIEAIAIVRGRYGSSVELRADANGAWTHSTAELRLRRLQPFGLRFIEEPVAGTAMMSLGAHGVPLAVDESLRIESVVRFAMSQPECVALVLKPTLLGGFSRCRRLRDAARDARKAVVVSHCFEGPVGFAHVRALACAIAMPEWACGVDSYLLTPAAPTSWSRRDDEVQHSQRSEPKT